MVDYMVLHLNENRDKENFALCSSAMISEGKQHHAWNYFFAAIGSSSYETSKITFFWLP
jgi:hypothetical protein